MKYDPDAGKIEKVELEAIPEEETTSHHPPGVRLLADWASKQAVKAAKAGESGPTENDLLKRIELRSNMTCLIDDIESKLSSGDQPSFLGGSQPSKEDSDKFVELQNIVPNVETHPHALAWYNLLSIFTEAVRVSWTDISSDPSKGTKITASKKQWNLDNNYFD